MMNIAPMSEEARDALKETRAECRPIPYLATRDSARMLHVPTSVLEVTGTRPSSGWAMFLAGAGCGVLILIALYVSL